MKVISIQWYRKMKGAILGISSGFHDSAAALLSYEGKILFASSEERFTRRKGDKSWPKSVILEILDYAELHDLTIKGICYYENPIKRLRWSLIQSFRASIPLREKIRRARLLSSSYIDLTNHLDSLLSQLNLSSSELFISDHHISHAAASFAFSSHNSGFVCVLDAFGQDCSGIIGYLSPSKSLRTFKVLSVDQSVGLFYSAITSICGFKILTGEYKVMGLAPYGKPIFFDKLVKIFGYPSINQFSTSILDPFLPALASKLLRSKLGIPSREQEGPIDSVYMDLAASAQKYLEYLVVDIFYTYLPKVPGSCSQHIFLGGGVALNCKLTYVLENTFPNYTFSICPSAGDSGSSVGACYAHLMEFNSTNLHANYSVHLGYSNDKRYIKSSLKSLGFKISIYEGSSLARTISSLLIKGKVGAICTGPSEFGPRALGSRSILANPNDNNAISFVNRSIKSREDFRPLAPVTTLEIYRELFDENSVNQLLYYMLTLVKIPSNVINIIPSAVHVDGTGRLQVLRANQNPFLHEIITCFYRESGVPALINTSFNQRGEPLVNTTVDALRCFCSTELDFLCIESELLIKSEQHSNIVSGFRQRSSFPLD
ncbi:carbamoyltransferase C-terminal domain-containing protein [Prochlorococcus marinus]|uniref:Carbamoyltransferase n=1 Tax=Prochlorococcus marinus (strain MIT 9303) TaxID=59922 RepID=A2CA26_PROM3|nr:carbamoyltransferase C-terminal domain-containing protein [Prochlorococcus marinus]ABM78336.1 Hypothetical protein P9303_15921 [Prochlorococcus marinus str. MIT 9303]